MSAVLAIALKDLRQRLRDRSAIVLGFIAPLAVAWLISVAFGSAGSFHANVAVVDLDGGPVAAGFSTFVKGPDLADLLTVKSTAGEADARAKVANGDLSAAFVIPKGVLRCRHLREGSPDHRPGQCRLVGRRAGGALPRPVVHGTDRGGPALGAVRGARGGPRRLGWQTGD